MDRIVTLHRPDELRPFAKMSLVEGFNPEWLSLHRVDEHLLLLQQDGDAGARCSLWWQDTPDYRGLRLGVIGHYAADDEASGTRILAHACERLREKDCTLAVGPMDGNTWRSYRLVTDRGQEPPFFLEPTNPESWPHQWLSSGFTPLAVYSSAVNSDLSVQDQRISRALLRFHDQGIRIRSLNPDDFNAELERIYAISVRSFNRNFLYTPMEKTEFLTQYRQIRPYIRPELALIAEDEHQPVGFLFALPDLAQAQRGVTMDTIIIKTVAVLPDRACRGLGTALVGHAQTIAHQTGFKRAIHALMHETNTSRNISAHYARTMRRYTLFSRELGHGETGTTMLK
ncbi:MAG: GNAT family N-acetyltransferase [Gammaproteobacteria bacterium]|nr:GNAT family N-acetyltransferase [Gammaproteobacteria bacterium]